MGIIFWAGSVGLNRRAAGGPAWGRTLSVDPMFSILDWASYRQRMRFKPQCARGNGRINPRISPPGGFTAAVMNFPMVSATQRDGEFVANLPPECPALRKSEMVGI